MSRLALLSITALVMLSACVPDRGPSYYRDGYYRDGYYRDSRYGYGDGYDGGSRYGYNDGYRYRDRYSSDRLYRGYYRQPAYDAPRPTEGP